MENNIEDKQRIEKRIEREVKDINEISKEGGKRATVEGVEGEIASSKEIR